MKKRKKSKIVQKKAQFLPSDRKKRYLVLGITAIFIIILAVALTYGTTKTESVASKNVNVQTSKGPIVLEIYPNKMPATVDNFDKLVKSNFYNGLTFHRVEDWVIQGGDPQGDGSGGPGWTIPLEINPELKNVRGAVAMARSSDPDSAGSQFYILKKDAPWLDGQYAVFGKVIKGMDVVNQVQAGDKMDSVNE